MSLLSISDALLFLERLDVGDLDHSDQSLQFLTQLVCAFQENIPFQNVSIMSTAVHDRCVPSLEEVVAKGLALEGGVCFDLNVFMCLLLKALGYQADVLDGSYSESPTPHTHVVVLVHNIRYPGDRHIVDVSTGFPFLTPVPIDELPITYHWAGLEVRYFREEEHVYRCQRKGDIARKDRHVMRGDWRQVFDFALQPVDYDFFIPHMKHVYVDDQKGNWFLNSIRACRFPRAPSFNTSETEASSQTNVKSNIQNNKIDDSHHLLAVKNGIVFNGPMCNLSIDDIGVDNLDSYLKQNFPKLPQLKVRAAINRYNNLNKS